jgi:hypothetical protein
MNFGAKNFTVRNDPKKGSYLFIHYNLLDPIKWGGITFSGWYSTKLLQGPMITSLSFDIQSFEKNESSNYIQNCLGILGVNQVRHTVLLEETFDGWTPNGWKLISTRSPIINAIDWTVLA